MRVLVCLLLLGLQASDVPDAKTREEYQSLVRQLDLENHPERHAQAAAWCQQKKWKTQADHHDLEFRRYQFRKEREKLKAEPTAADLKRLADLAVKLKLETESSESRGVWIDAELRERRAKLKEDDAAGLKALLTWAVKEEAAPRAGWVAKELLKLEGGNELANQILGRVKEGADWIDPWELLVKKGGLKDLPARVSVHKLVASLRPKKARAFPPNPLATFEKVQKPGYGLIWKDHIRAGDGKGIMYLYSPRTYSSAKSYPLVVQLHGGGDGGIAFAENQAFAMIQDFAQREDVVEFISVAPWARNHVGDSWKFRENALDVVDAVIDVCERFNVDRRRIYLTGASMGGQGTQVLSWTIPELFPAFCPRSGYYLNDFHCPDLTGKQYLVFHGGQDTVVGQKTHGPFLEKIKKAGATAELVFFPDVGHILPKDKVVNPMIEFFKRPGLTLDYDPDLTLVRKMVEELLPWNKRPEGVAAAPPPAKGDAGRDPKPAPPGGKAVDLLEKVDPAKDAVAGIWRLEGKILLTPGTEFARLQSGVTAPEEYDVRIVVERADASKPDSFVVGLVGGGTSFMVGLDGGQGTKSGLDAVDGKSFSNGNETTRAGSVLAGDKPNTIVASVRKDRVTVTVDGKPVVDWKADYARLSLRDPWSMNGARALFLGSFKCSYRVTAWELVPSGSR